MYALDLEEYMNEEEEDAAQANGESRAKVPAPRKSKKLTEEEKDRNQRRARNTDKAICSMIGPQTSREIKRMLANKGSSFSRTPLFGKMASQSRFPSWAAPQARRYGRSSRDGHMKT